MEFDHIVHLVQDLDEARSQYEELGFVIKTGGKHPDGTQNIVTRLHRAYIEPIAVVDWESLREKTPADYDLFQEVIADGGGAIGLGISVSNIEQVVNHLRASGIQFILQEGSVQHDDGTTRHWRYILPTGGPIKWQPFMIDYGVDWGERAQRYGDADRCTISRVVVETENPEEYGRWLAAVLGSTVTPIDGGVRVVLENGDVDLTKGSAERITQVLFKETNAPVGDVQRLHFGIQL